MNDNLKKLVTALRSGEYQQGRMVLRTYNDKFCCLGVATDLYIKDVGGEWKEQNDSDYYRFYHEEGNSCSISLVDQIIEYYGLSYDKMSKLMGMNDEYRKSFDEIASYIEENY